MIKSYIETHVVLAYGTLFPTGFFNNIEEETPISNDVLENMLLETFRGDRLIESCPGIIIIQEGPNEFAVIITDEFYLHYHLKTLIKDDDDIHVNMHMFLYHNYYEYLKQFLSYEMEV